MSSDDTRKTTYKPVSSQIPNAKSASEVIPLLKKSKPRSLIPVVCTRCDVPISDYAELLLHVMHYHKEQLSQLINKNRFKN